MNALGKLCPVCGKENEKSAILCVHCGAELDEGTATRSMSAPEKPDNAQTGLAESFIDPGLIPDGGIGIHIAGEIKSIYVKINKELIMGRVNDAGWANPETILDLSDKNAGSLGVSRQHVMIRRTENGFEATDLASRNGTWLNAERLIPNKPYPFPSGSQLRIGQMRLLIMYHPVTKDP